MTNQYDRVSYPDKVQFASELEDDHDGVGHQTGNGIYNDYTVRIPPKLYTESFKVACFRIEKTRRTAFILCGVLVLVILVIIIAVAANGHIRSQSGNKPPQSKQGLVAYPYLEDGSSVISFDPMDYNSYNKYIENMEFHMNDYDIIKQESHLESYVVCAWNRTAESLSEGQVCMQTPITFGPYCQHMNLYGFKDEQPCVLLVLKLEEGVKPEPYDVNSVTDPALKNKLSDSVKNGMIPIRCEGKTEADRKNMMITDVSNNNSTTDIQYHPTGFPLYFFPVKSNSNYINPAVMVQFRSVKMDADVTVRCTAWVKDGDKSPQDDGSIYATEFTFRMYHKPAG